MPLTRRIFPGKSRFGAALRALAAGVFSLSLGVLDPTSAEAASPFLVVPEPGVAELSPAYRYANMTDEEALAELDKRQILYSRVGPVHGVRAPIRLTGRLHGVYFHSSLPPEQRATSIFEILDARLALALDDFAAVLAQHDIDEVVHYTMYRPNVARPGHDDHDEDGGKPAAARKPVVEKAVANKAAPPDNKSASDKAAPQKAALPDKTASDKAAPPKAAPDTTNKGAPRAQKPAADAKPKAGAKAPLLESKTAEPARKTPPSSKSSLSGKASLDFDSKKSARQAPSAIKQKSAPSLAPKSAASPAPAAQPRAAKAAPTPKAGISLPRGPVASLRAPASRPRATWAPPGTRHPAGLAIDVGLLRKRDGRWLSVAGHFHGKIGDKTCGPGVTSPESADARELRAIVCESSDLGIFTYVLTPNYNAAHADHYHMEIKPGVRWFLYH